MMSISQNTCKRLLEIWFIEAIVQRRELPKFTNDECWRKLWGKAIPCKQNGNTSAWNWAWYWNAEVMLSWCDMFGDINQVQKSTEPEISICDYLFLHPSWSSWYRNTESSSQFKQRQTISEDSQGKSTHQIHWCLCIPPGETTLLGTLCFCT